MILRNGSKATLACFLAVATGLIFSGGCGGSSSSSSTSTPAANNTAPMTVGFGPLGAPGGFVDGLFTSVTVCLPGTSTCQTIPDVLVDSESVGLRILNSALTTFPASSLGTITNNGNQLQECLQFGDLSYVWGPVLVADVELGGEKASSVPIQVIGDTTFNAPSNCFGTNPIGLNDDTVANLGANGILGVQNYAQDCGGSCTSSGAFFTGYPYYVCPSDVCSETFVPLTSQVWNTVAAFSSADNNGVLITLPSIPATGAADGSVSGSLIFGIGTQTDNALASSAIVYALDAYGNFPQVTYNGTQYTSPNNGSFIDTGSSGLFVLDASTLGIADCRDNGYYCPSQTLTLSNIALTGYGNVGSGTVSLSIANADALFAANPTFAAFNNLGSDSGTGPSTDFFDFGLPFFFGRRVYIGMMPGQFSGESSAPSGASSTYGYWAF